MKSLTVLALALAVIVAAGCDGNNTNPAGPTVAPPPPATPRYPAVAGTCRGDVTAAAGGQTVHAGVMTATVTQAGSSVTITGSYTTPNGQRVGLPATTGVINTTGFFTQTGGGAASETAYDPDCGTLRGTGERISFNGRQMSYWAEISSSLCGLITFSATLRR